MWQVLQTEQSWQALLLADFQIDAQLATCSVAFLRSHRNMGRSGNSGIVKYSIMLDTANL